MQSTLEPKLSDDPHDVLVVAPDVVLVVPTDEELSRLARSMRHDSNPQARNEPDFSAGPAVPPVDTTFRAVPVNRPSIGARAMRGFIGFLLALCIGVAAAAWQAYGDAAKQMFAEWAPLVVLTSPPPENPGLARQPGSSATQASAEQAAPAQPATAESAAPAAAALAAEPSPSLQSMARDLAAAQQQIEQLKASIEQLKAGQEQTSRDVAKAADAKASEQNLRPKISALPPRPAAAPARKPMPPFRPAQAAATQTLPPAAAPYPPRQPDYVPRQVEPLPPPPAPPPLDPELTSVPRPPLPLRE